MMFIALSVRFYRILFGPKASLFVLHGVEHVSQATLATVLAIEMGSHKDSSAAIFCGALASQSVDLAVIVDAVVLQDGQLDLLVLVFDLLGSGVVLLLALLATTTESEDQVKGRF